MAVLCSSRVELPKPNRKSAANISAILQRMVLKIQTGVVVDAFMFPRKSHRVQNQNEAFS